MKQKLSDYVGNTPLIPIIIDDFTVWGKAEFMNPSGSVKDRMATYIINNAEKMGLVKRGDTLCEATSGNSGISLAMLASERGYNMIIIMPSNMSVERKNMFKLYGAELIEVDEGDFDGAIEMRDKMCNDKRSEKYVLRKAFEGLIPDEILWRQKEQFSDGVGYSWIDSLVELANSTITDNEMEESKIRYSFNTPKKISNSKIKYTFKIEHISAFSL